MIHNTAAFYDSKYIKQVLLYNILRYFTFFFKFQDKFYGAATESDNPILKICV